MKKSPPPIPLPPEAFNTPELKRKLAKAILVEHYQRYPRFWEALEKDAKIFLQVRGEDSEVSNRAKLIREALRLSWETDAFFALTLYRVRGRLLARGVPVLPTILHKVCMALSQLDIGEPVLIEPGVYIPHGQVVIDGRVEVGRGTVLTPWVTIGLIEGKVDGPKIGRWTFIGTGAKLLGKIEVGPRSRIGANSVVVKNVPAGVTVTGAPARPVGAKHQPSEKMRQAIADKLRRDETDEAGKPPTSPTAPRDERAKKDR